MKDVISYIFILVKSEAKEASSTKTAKLTSASFKAYTSLAPS